MPAQPTTAKKLYKPQQAAMPTAGKNYLVYVNVGTDETTGAEWLLLGGQRTSDVSRKADSIDASHKGTKGWKATIPGLKEWSIDLETLLMPNEESLQLLEKAFLNDDLINIKIEYPNKAYMTGICSITELSMNTPHDDVATYKGSLNGVGPLSELKQP